LVLFDVDVAAAPFTARYAALGRLVAAWDPDPAVVAVLPVHDGEQATRALLAAAVAQRNEGIVLRRSDAAYVAGRSPAGRAGALLRWKFQAHLDCIITAVDIDGHASAEIALLDPNYGRKGRVVPIGTVGTEGKWPAVAPGQIWTVTCSGTYRGPGRQPRLMHGRLTNIRTDKAWSECCAASCHRHSAGIRTSTQHQHRKRPHHDLDH
jgi:ATP-dependent DNA ligase